jgi:hypothetical protein
MALTFDLMNIENYRETGYDRDGNLRPLTELLIFTTISAGLGEITEKNVEEFYARMVVIHKLHDIGIVEDGIERMITPEEVRNHIGLTTNVGNETRAQWVRRNFTAKNSILSDFKRNYRAAMKVKVS